MAERLLNVRQKLDKAGVDEVEITLICALDRWVHASLDDTGLRAIYWKYREEIDG